MCAFVEIFFLLLPKIGESWLRKGNQSRSRVIFTIFDHLCTVRKLVLTEIFIDQIDISKVGAESIRVKIGPG